MNYLETAIAELIRSNVDKRHPFRTMVLGTSGGDYPQLRTVVNRKFSKNDGITFYTDSRSPKVNQILANPQVSLLFYHPKKKLQLRILGIANFLDQSSDQYRQALQSIKQSPSAKDYTTALPPGSHIDSVEYAYGDTLNAAVVQVELKEIEVLLLDRDGHQRRLYTIEDGDWMEQVLVP